MQETLTRDSVVKKGSVYSAEPIPKLYGLMPPKGNMRKKLPDPLPEGFILTDFEKKHWKLGKVIGNGGFGLIHLASPATEDNVSDDAMYVVKIEHQDNGPLFTELKFYQRVAKSEHIKKWMKDHRLSFLGIPAYWGSGLVEHNGKSYRFMVLDRLGVDLQKVLEASGNQLSKTTVLLIGSQLLEILEFIHEHEYIHGDIKSANLLLGFRNHKEIYLADYGLAFRYHPNGAHKQYKEDPKKGHNGTIEFTSIDAHKGVGHLPGTVNYNPSKLIGTHETAAGSEMLNARYTFVVCTAHALILWMP